MAKARIPTPMPYGVRAGGNEALLVIPLLNATIPPGS
jgi:hypothetical protein